jgi:hypothetical protein
VQGDADLLMQVWAEDEETLCVHPTGVRLLAGADPRELAGIFANTKLRVQAETVARWQGSVLAIHHLTEILFVGDDPSPHGPLHVTHVYGRGATAGAWSAATPRRPMTAIRRWPTPCPHTLH